MLDGRPSNCCPAHRRRSSRRRSWWCWPATGSSPSRGRAARWCCSRVAKRPVRWRLRRSFADLGPTYVKFGQLIASSPGLFPEFLAAPSCAACSIVPPEPVARCGVSSNATWPPDRALFADFDDDPVAAASIAQVHRARLHDGTDVAVKVRRPHLRGRIEQDLRLLRLLAGVLARAGALGEMLNPTADRRRPRADVAGRARLRREAASMAPSPPTSPRSAPTTMRGSSPDRRDGRRAGLVMTYVDGTPVDDGTALRAAGHDLEGLVRTGVRAWLEGALEHGLFHGDVHAGNLFVTPVGEIAFLDFGIMGHLDDRTRLVLRRALPAVLIDGDFAPSCAPCSTSVRSPPRSTWSRPPPMSASCSSRWRPSRSRRSATASSSATSCVATPYHVVFPR